MSDIGWRACKQAPISKGCNSEPSKRRFTPGSITSLPSASSSSAFIAVVEAASSSGLMAASQTGARAYDLQIYPKN